MNTMNKAKFDEFLNTYEFQKYADIVSNGKYALFENIQAEGIGCGYIYLWVEQEKNPTTFTVVYVGKAGKTMKQRCREQVGGFKGGSKKGVTHSKNILKGIRAGKHYWVYTRKSETKTVMDVPGISLCCAEETAFIKKLNPPWNKINT
jgi:hypothetical protein